MRVTRHSEAGQVTVPVDLAVGPPPLLSVRVGSTFSPVLTGAVRDAGVYVFTDVPPGERYLQVGSTWVVGPSPTIDFSYRVLGRSDVQFADAGVRLNIDVSGLSPWAAWNPQASQFDLVAPNADLWLFSFDQVLTGWPDAGQTSGRLAAAYTTTTYNYYGTPLIDTTRGDVVYLAQMARDQVTIDALHDPMLVRSLESAAIVTPLVQANGQASTVSATLVQTSPTVSVNLDWRRSSFWALAPQVHPSAQAFSFDQGYVDAIPYFGGAGQYGAAPDLVTLGPATYYASTDVAFSRPVHNPFPADWALFVLLETCFSATAQQMGDAGHRWTPSGCVSRMDPFAAVNGQPLSAQLGPPANLKVDGVDAYGPVALAGPGATLSWSAPKVGTPDTYTVSLYSLTKGTPPYVAQRVRATFRTEGTSLVLPPAVLVAGRFYGFSVTAVKGSNPSTPLETALPLWQATAISGVLEVP
jgi:hypothetical protein